MLSPLSGTMKWGSLTTPKATPLKPLSLVHQGEAGVEGHAGNAKQGQDLPSPESGPGSPAPHL